MSASVAAFFAAFVVVVVDSLSFLEPLVNPPFGETLPPFAGLLFGLMVVGEKLFVRLFSLLPEPVGDVNFCDDFEDLQQFLIIVIDIPELDLEAEPV